MKSFVSFLLLLLAGPAWAVPVCDTITSSVTEADPQDISYTPAAGSLTTKIVLVHVGIRTSDATGTADAVTLGGNAMTSYGSANSASAAWSYLFYLAYASDSAATVSVPYSGTITDSTVVAMTCTGVNAASPFRAAAVTANGTDGTVTVGVTSSAVGDLVIDAVNANARSDSVSPDPAVGASQTSLYNVANGGVNSDTAGSSEAGSASTVTMSWTLADSTNRWATVAGSLVPGSISSVKRKPIIFQ